VLTRRRRRLKAPEAPPERRASGLVAALISATFRGVSTSASLPLPTTALPHDVLRAVLSALDQGRRVVLSSVVARHGSAPSTPGQKLALLDEHTAIGTIGGGAVERVVLGAMAQALADPASEPKLSTFRLGASLGMCCGGSVDILIEPLHPEAHALVIGAGHVGVFVAPLLASLGFRVTLCDSREEAADPGRLAPPPPPPAAGPAAPQVRVIHAEHDDPEVLRGFTQARERAAVLVMTHDHQLDQAAIEWAIERGFGFVGGVGSRAKAARTRTRLEAKGISEADIARVRMPVGAAIFARSPAEIGVAIAAELIAWRARRADLRAPGHTEAEPSSAPLVEGET
jgi:xanthine dehydrogenase accessory factor